MCWSLLSSLGDESRAPTWVAKLNDQRSMGLGLLKRGYAEWSEPVAALQRQIKAGFDPKGLLNPGKKLPADDPVSG